MHASDLSLSQFYRLTRAKTNSLCQNLSSEDMVVQSMPDASPAKWHLAHTTWFFETFILQPHLSNYRLFDASFSHLFNSYYVSAGSRFNRPQRGLITRPSLEEVKAYRNHVDELMMTLIDRGDSEINDLCVIGLHHEMQHQELLLTDILHAFSFNPSFPAIFERSKAKPVEPTVGEMKNIEGTMTHVGAEGEAFSYDCERPNHLTYLAPHALSNRLVTNGEWLAFMEEGAYSEPLIWLSDGWACAQKNMWEAPLYWIQKDKQWFQFGLDGLHEVDMNAPVSHVSFYEADAFARWSGKRLPKEHELEHAAQLQSTEGNFLESQSYRPKPATESSAMQLYGDVWEWTQSAFLPYPNFSAEQGALGEYNGKFMVNQFVLKGGSCVTPELQMRPSYRNFFYPHHRWQFTGLRLAEDL